jgi:hypothetical protein
MGDFDRRFPHGVHTLSAVAARGLALEGGGVFGDERLQQVGVGPHHLPPDVSMFLHETIVSLQRQARAFCGY